MTYVLTSALLATGWWLRSGHEGQPSTLARLLDMSDVEVHRRAGWAFGAVIVIALTVGARAAVTFVRETLSVDRGDGRWWRRWPAGAFTGRFAPHRRHFDPGQRAMNVAFVVTLGTLVVSGIGLTMVHGGPEFATLVKFHRAATYVLTVLVCAHVFVALGVLPGYRGAWRSMHLGGRTPESTVRRLWPATIAPPDSGGAVTESDTPPSIG